MRGRHDRDLLDTKRPKRDLDFIFRRGREKRPRVRPGALVVALRCSPLRRVCCQWLFPGLSQSINTRREYSATTALEWSGSAQSAQLAPCEKNISGLRTCSRLLVLRNTHVGREGGGTTPAKKEEQEEKEHG